MKGTKKLANAITAILVAAASGAIPATAAQAQTEVLQGTATTVSGSGSGSCPWVSFRPYVNIGFNAAGTATGPYPGTFISTGVHAAFAGAMTRFSMGSSSLSMPFTIATQNSAGTPTTVTGSVSSGRLMGACIGSPPVGFTARTYAGFTAQYTATVQTQGQNAQTVTGTAQFSGTFYINSAPNTTFQASFDLP